MRSLPPIPLIPLVAHDAGRGAAVAGPEDHPTGAITTAGAITTSSASETTAALFDTSVIRSDDASSSSELSFARSSVQDPTAWDIYRPEIQ